MNLDGSTTGMPMCCNALGCRDDIQKEIDELHRENAQLYKANKMFKFTLKVLVVFLLLETIAIICIAGL